jgi:hypothetical protein
MVIIKQRSIVEAQTKIERIQTTLLQKTIKL